MPSLNDLPESPEAKIVRNFFRVLKEDSRIAGRFKTIRLVELPRTTAVPQFDFNTLIVCPSAVVPRDHPMRRQTTRVQILVGFFVPWESTDRDSDLIGLNLLNLVRIVVWENIELKDTIADPDKVITFATAELEPERLIPMPASGSRVIWGTVTLETDIDPLTGEII